MFASYLSLREYFFRLAASFPSQSLVFRYFLGLPEHETSRVIALELPLLDVFSRPPKKAKHQKYQSILQTGVFFLGGVQYIYIYIYKYIYIYIYITYIYIYLYLYM